MKFYLKFINPIISAIILIICIYAAINEKGSGLKVSNLIAGGLPTYFLAKGLFCSSTLFILGKILENILNKKIEE